MIVLGMEVLLSGVLGIVFLVAAIPKLRHPGGFVLAVLEYRVLPIGFSWFYARLVPPLEFLLALLLLTGTAVRSSAIVASLLLLTFIAAVGINLARGRDLDCNCFGKARRSIGWGLMLQDVALLCVAVALALMSEWVAAEPWSVLRLSGLVQAGSSSWPLLGCGGLTVCAIVLLNRRIYERRYGSRALSK
jgi:putative oxidoreductase